MRSFAESAAFDASRERSTRAEVLSLSAASKRLHKRARGGKERCLGWGGGGRGKLRSWRTLALERSARPICNSRQALEWRWMADVDGGSVYSTGEAFKTPQFRTHHDQPVKLSVHRKGKQKKRINGASCTPRWRNGGFLFLADGRKHLIYVKGQATEKQPRAGKKPRSELRK